MQICRGIKVRERICSPHPPPPSLTPHKHTLTLTHSLTLTHKERKKEGTKQKNQQVLPLLSSQWWYHCHDRCLDFLIRAVLGKFYHLYPAFIFQSIKLSASGGWGHCALNVRQTNVRHTGCSPLCLGAAFVLAWVHLCSCNEASKSVSINSMSPLEFEPWSSDIF